MTSVLVLTLTKLAFSSEHVISLYFIVSALTPNSVPKIAKLLFVSSSDIKYNYLLFLFH